MFSGVDGCSYWRCIETKLCNGRLKTDSDDENPEERGSHNHPPNPDKVTVRNVRSNIRLRAAVETVSIPTIYRQETRVLATAPAAAAIMPAYHSVSTTAYRERGAMLPTLPRTRRDITIPPSIGTTSGGRFLLNCGPNNDYIMFATDANLQRLCNSPLICIDGTFDAAPKLFMQLFSIHAFVGERLVPLVYVLMSSKAQVPFSKSFQLIFSLLVYERKLITVFCIVTNMLRDFAKPSA